VVVGTARQAERSRFTVLRPHWVGAEPPPPDRALEVKIRHRHAGAVARVASASREKLEVELLAPARAVAPGQAAVFYEGDRVLGGGWIA
jgi:tRNA-specific 2-thiouridylase